MLYSEGQRGLDPIYVPTIWKGSRLFEHIVPTYFQINKYFGDLKFTYAGDVFMWG